MTTEQGSLMVGLEGLVHPSLRQVRSEILARHIPPYPQIVDPSVLRTGDLLHTVDRLEKIPRVGHIVLSVHPDATFQKAGQTISCLPQPHLHALEGDPVELSAEESRRLTELLNEDSPKSLEDRVREAEWLRGKGFKEDVRGFKVMGILPENDGADRDHADWFYLLQSNLVQPSPLI